MGTRKNASGSLTSAKGYGKVPSLKRESKEFELDEHSEQVIRQTTIALPFLEERVPALYIADGRPYIPVLAVCRVLGIRADTHTQHWRRLVWCLHISEVPYLYGLFDWSPLPPERRRQLYEATHAHAQLLGQVYQKCRHNMQLSGKHFFLFSRTRRSSMPHFGQRC